MKVFLCQNKIIFRLIVSSVDSALHRATIDIIMINITLRGNKRFHINKILVKLKEIFLCNNVMCHERFTFFQRQLQTYLFIYQK